MVGLDHDDCLATYATSRDLAERIEDFEDQDIWRAECPPPTVAVAAPQPKDDRPCNLCNRASRQDDMVLCDHCDACYHRDCASKSRGTKLHDGPWFCATCKGSLTLQGYPDITQDWPLIDHLWTGWLPQDPVEADRLQRLAVHYRAHGEELQVKLPKTATEPERWVDVPPLITRPRLMMDTHDSLGHCGRDKLLATLKTYFWWPGMHSDVAECLRRCPVCQKDRPPRPRQEPVRWIDKGTVPFAGWSLDAAGPFPPDEDGNRYLLVAVDPFSKWVEAVPTPSLHSWRAADFLYQRIITHWGKPRYIRTDNGSEF